MSRIRWGLAIEYLFTVAIRTAETTTNLKVQLDYGLLDFWETAIGRKWPLLEYLLSLLVSARSGRLEIV